MMLGGKKSYEGTIDDTSLESAFIIGESSVMEDENLQYPSGEHGYIQSPHVASVELGDGRYIIKGSFILGRYGESGSRAASVYDFELLAAPGKEKTFGDFITEYLKVSETLVLEGGAGTVSEGSSEELSGENLTAAESAEVSAGSAKEAVYEDMGLVEFKAGE